MRSDSVRSRTITGISTTDGRHSPANGHREAVTKISGETRNVRRPLPTRNLNDGHRLTLADLTTRRPSPKPSQSGMYPAIHGSAPPEITRVRPLDRSPRKTSPPPSRSRRNLDFKAPINTTRRRETSPEPRPSRVVDQSPGASPRPEMIPSQRTSKSMPAHSRRVRPVATDPVRQAATRAAFLANNYCNKEVDNVTVQNNGESHCEGTAHKIRGPISAGVASDIRRGQRTLSVKSTPFNSHQLGQHHNQLPDHFYQESPTTIEPFHRASSLQSKDSVNSIKFWSRMKAMNSRETPKQGTNSTSFKGFRSETPMDSLFLIDDNQTSKISTMNPPITLSSSAGEYAGLEGSASAGFSHDGSDKEDQIAGAASRYFGIPFRKKKLKKYECCSPKSVDEPDTATSWQGRESKLSRVVRRLGNALNRKPVNQDDSKSNQLKSFLRAVISVQSSSVDSAFIPEKRLQSGKSLSSDNTSETGSSIDMDELKAADPQLYSTILETVASWCDHPTAEPQDTADALSTRTFSSISFRDRNGRQVSQDLTNFEPGTTLAEEEAFLTDVVEGRIEHSSVSSASSLRDEPIGIVDKAPNVRESLFDDGKADVKEMEDLKNAIDTLCKTGEGDDNSDEISHKTSQNSIPLPSSFLHLTDSDTDDDDNFTKQNPSQEDFLHLTSSEFESMEISTMREVLQMQGIWLFNWDRCAELWAFPPALLKSACLRKYTNDGARGIEITVEDQSVKCYRYPVLHGKIKEPLERVVLDGPLPVSTSNITNLKGTLTSMGLRTMCKFPDGSRREELVWIERDGLCVQITAELPSAVRHVTRIYLKRLVLNTD